MGLRRKGRILAFQALYAWDASNTDVDILFTFPWADKKPPAEACDFARLIVSGTIENIDDIDDMIADHLEKWDFDRIAFADRAILRMSVYQLMFLKDIPPRVVIDEALEIAKEFSGKDSYRFVNGILDALVKEINRE
ncbi:transcription antitermination factor NusB [Spirochaetia bacterium 38H-sp]|uniref:Transcription antitermination protein NusB n=1 Tax=Rarispira pelagica TaxID=3141764 RepID=A0ABU9UCY6_9SPIR